MFALWEDICQRYERGEIGIYQVDEMKDVIMPNLKALAALRTMINNTPVVGDKARKTKKRKNA